MTQLNNDFNKKKTLNGFHDIRRYGNFFHTDADVPVTITKQVFFIRNQTKTLVVKKS